MKIRTDCWGHALPQYFVVDKAPSGERFYCVRPKGSRAKRFTGFEESHGATRKGWDEVQAAHRKILNEFEGNPTLKTAGLSITFPTFYEEYYRPQVAVRTKTALKRVRPGGAEYKDVPLTTSARLRSSICDCRLRPSLRYRNWDASGRWKPRAFAGVGDRISPGERGARAIRSTTERNRKRAPRQALHDLAWH